MSLDETLPPTMPGTLPRSKAESPHHQLKKPTNYMDLSGYYYLHEQPNKTRSHSHGSSHAPPSTNAASTPSSPHPLNTTASTVPASLHDQLTGKSGMFGMMPVPPPVYGSLGRKKAEKLTQTQQFATVSSGSALAKHMTKTGRMPVPHRTQQVFQAVHTGLLACIEQVQTESRELRDQIDDSTSTAADSAGGESGRSYELEKQLKVTERYLKRLEFQVTQLEELQDEYLVNLRIQKGTENLASALDTSKGRSPSKLGLRGNLKQVLIALNEIELRLIALMGTMHVDIKGIAAFARIAPGDTFEVLVRHGEKQKLKCKGKVLKDTTQQWENTQAVFKCMFDEALDIKATEVHTFTKSKILSEQPFDPLQLFTAVPQLLTMNLNQNGSIKLQVVVTWQPVEYNTVLTPINLDRVSSPPLHVATNPLKSPVLSAKSPHPAKSPASSKKKERRAVSVYYGNGPVPFHTDENDVGYQDQSGLSSRSLPRKKHQSVLLNSPASASQQWKSTENLKAVARKPSTEPVNPGPPFVKLMRVLKPLIQKLLNTYPELSRLEELVYKWDNFLKTASRTQDTPVKRSSLNMRNSASLESGIARMRIEESDDPMKHENDSGVGSSYRGSPPNVIGGRRQAPSHSAESSAESEDTGSTPPVTISGGRGVTGPAQRRFKQIKEKNQRKTLGNLDELLSAGSAETMTSVNINVLTTGNSELDRSLYHHLLRCHALLRSLEDIHGSLQYREDLYLYRLEMEMNNLTCMCGVTQYLPRLPSLPHVLRDLQTSTELHDVWASATAGTKSTLIVSARLLREELQNTYAWVVRTRYPDLVTQVFDTIMQLLTDNNNWNPDIITVYQFISAYREKKLAAFIEGLAHEAWIILSLCSRAKSQIVHVFQRLSQVPVVPPTDCLRHIALLLIDTQAEIRNMAESYLNRSSGGLREDMIAGYRVLLEHDHNATRSAACRALAVLKAEQCIRALDYISRSDTDAVVRQEAKRALGSFDVLAAERAIVGDQAYIAVNRCDTRM